jgi:urease accessory protein
LAILPDPVTCFSTARYSQKQVFRVLLDSNLVIVDWFTSGRHESGEKWDFDLYKSTNNIFFDDNQPLFLDTVMFFLHHYSTDWDCPCSSIEILLF